MAIFESVCSTQGHKIDSIRINDKMVQLPGASAREPVLVPQYLTLCTACGLSLEEIKIKESQPPKRTRTRKPKPPAPQENP